MKRIFKFFGCLVMFFSLMLGMTSCASDEKTEADGIKAHTIAEILELCEADTNERYLVRGEITEISNPQYGEMTIKDATGSLYVYGTYDSTGEKRYSELEDKPLVGDEVLLSGLATTYNGKKELKSAWILEVKHNSSEFNEADYEKMNIKSAREALPGTKIKLTGVVAKITYANGMKPSGLILVDETESIYVYDMMIASEAKIGNTLTVCGSRDSWINSDEKNEASKFGYKGSTQISKCHKITLSDTKQEPNLAWVKDNTVKNIVNNQPSNDITSTIFKVNGLVKKSVNPGFTNYFIYDLDGKTGSYVYTQCNGNDFTWLDEFDGKICTIYLSPFNAKATSAGIQYRFLPVIVKDEGYQFDLSTGAEFALNYFAIDQFGKEYQSNPNLELAKEVSFSHLGLNNVVLSYSSNNTNAIKFVDKGDKLVMETINTLTTDVVVTVKASYSNQEAYKDITIKVIKTPTVSSVNVKAAIDSQTGDTLNVKGIVGASLVNKDGFYLIDETGVIAVTTTKDVLAKINLGDEVVIKATKALVGKSSSDIKYHYQLILKDAELLLNSFGNHQYSLNSFKNMTLAEAKAMDVNIHENTELGIIVDKVQIEFTEGGYSSNVFLVDGDTKIMLYASGAKQYKWLEAFKGKNVKVEIALCNWNSAKGGYKATVLAVYNEDGTKVINNLNFGS